MILAVIAVGLLGWWLHRRGELVPALRQWGAVLALGLLVLKLLQGGQIVGAAVALAAAAFWYFGTRQRLGTASEEARARALLGVAADADADAVHAAWRRALATAHPDAGGSSDATAQATAARDLLLARLARR